MILFASLGSSEISFRESFLLFIRKITGYQSASIRDLDAVYETIVFKVRWPRILLSALVGAALAQVGAAYQSIFMNSLADPHILGISSGAAFGASLVLVFGVPLAGFGLTAVGMGGFIGGLIAILLLYLLSPKKMQSETSRILLAGIALASLFSALMSLLMLFNREKLASIYYWTMGSFSTASWDKVIFLATIFFPISLLLLFHAPELNIILSGDEEAESLGVNSNKLRWRIIFFATILVAASVSVSGVVGFIGLIVPHALRLLKIHDLRLLLPASGILGAAFAICCDSFARLAIPPTEIPVGVVTAFFGVPLFLSLLYRSGQEKI
ncbi:MAG: iron ABC transporter permease [Eubacteriales bacterium]|nr:iron ABC transporter permease [Eubacteriales bacterium]